MIARYAQLISHFREQILDGSLASGARLPTEIELAAEHQISRGTVRQAMSALVNEGLLERVRGRGTFVRPLLPIASPTPRAADRRIGLVLAHSSGSQLDLDILIGVESLSQ